MATVGTFEGDVWRTGDDGYEAARQAAVWHLRKPDRYPDVIVCVASDQDVVAAVQLAHESGLKVKARGRGHSFTASHIRDGILIDFVDLREITIDPEARTATVTPSVSGMELNEALSEHGLFFPGGHCSDVGLGGYLLQGGFGWNGRSLGPACASVRAIDVVTADGELIHSDDSTNPDFVWAARGAGPGFFGCVTRFHLDLHPAPATLLHSMYFYPLETFTDVVPWFLDTASALPRWVEPFLIASEPPEFDGPVMMLLAMAYADSVEEGRDALAVFEGCPVLERAVGRTFAAPTSFRELYAVVDAVGAEGYRYCVDGMWTDEDTDVLVPELRELFMNIPSPQSSVVLLPWCETEVPNGVFSMQARLYVSPFALWENSQDDDRCIGWATDQMRRLEPLSKGIQLADENLINRPAPFLAADELERLERLRAKHDPDGIFHSYLLDDG